MRTALLRALLAEAAVTCAKPPFGFHAWLMHDYSCPIAKTYEASVDEGSTMTIEAPLTDPDEPTVREMVAAAASGVTAAASGVSNLKSLVNAASHVLCCVCKMRSYKEAIHIVLNFANTHIQ